MIQFTKSPTGRYRLAYSEGDTVGLDSALEKELIENDFAVEINQETIESNAGGLQPDDSTASPRKARAKNRKQ